MEEKRLFNLEELLGMFNKNDIQKVVAIEKKMVNFLTDSQLEEIAKCEKEILNGLVGKAMSYDNLQANYNKVADKLESIGLNINNILGTPNEEEEEEEDYEEEDYEEEDYEEEEED